MDFQLNSIEEALEDIRQGKVIIVVDDEDRENEGDFICAAESVTPAIINFMAKHGRGLICTPITEIRARELDLRYMVQENTALHQTAFTVSIVCWPRLRRTATRTRSWWPIYWAKRATHCPMPSWLHD